jgi:hypothetical protein
MLKIMGIVVVGYLLIVYGRYTYFQIKTPGVSPLKVLARKIWRERKLLFGKIWYELKFFLMWPFIEALGISVKVLLACVMPLVGAFQAHRKKRRAVTEKTTADQGVP